MTASNKPVTAHEVESALERVVDHRAFAGAARLRQLLEYVVLRELEGRGEELKEYSIGIDVLDKPASFDPQTDSAVRVMLGRVRNALELYYATDGANDPVHIVIPRGGYQPQLERVTATVSAPHPVEHDGADQVRPGKPTRRSLWIAAGLVGLGLLASWGWSERPAPEPAVVTAPQPETRIRLLVQHLQPQPGNAASPLTARLAAGLSGELVSDMLVYPWMNVVQWPDAGEPLSEIASMKDQSSRFDYALSGTVAASDGMATVTVRLQDIPSLKVKWSRTWQQPLDAGSTTVEEFQRRMVSEIAGQLASEKGLLPELAIARKGPERKVDFSGFQCFLGIYQYWDVPTASAHEQLRTCLEAAVSRNPSYADAWAALTYIYIDEQRYRRNPRVGADSWADATRALAQAIKLEPSNPLVLGAAMTLAIERPERDVEAFHKFGNRALELRPNDSFMLANYGMKRAIYLGEWAQGLEMNRKAKALSVEPPAWYNLLPAFDAVRRADDAGMIELTERLPLSHSVAANIMRAIAANRAGRKDLLVRYVAMLREEGVTEPASATAYIRARRFEPELGKLLERQFQAAFEAASTS